MTPDAPWKSAAAALCFPITAGARLDGSRSAFDQLAEIVDAVGDRIDVMMDGGVQRGTHVLKALSLGAKAVGLGRYYLFPLAAAGQPGVERALEPDAYRNRARHEADGLHLRRSAYTPKPSVPLSRQDGYRRT